MRAGALAAYGFLALPLAMVALPVYVQVPAWYVQQIGMAVPTTGYVLFAARILDTGQDPWLGRAIDALARRGLLGPALCAAALVLALAFAAVWFPPAPAGGRAWLPVAWLALMLALTYSAHSVLNITLLAWGARVAPDTRGRTAAGAWREACGLAGVVLASVLPAALVAAAGAPRGAARAMGWYVALFAGLLLLGLALLLRGAPRWIPAPAPAGAARARPAAVRRLWLPYLVNALAVAIPATLALFYIRDRIQRPEWSGGYLALYFVAGAAGMPAWTWLSARIGPARAWAAAMAMAVACFAGAAALGPGDALAFALVCLFSGLALGADLVLPPVLLAGALGRDRDPAADYGIWTLLGKLATAVSALALPALDALGYEPGIGGGSGAGGVALVFAYAVLPCVLKLLALALLVFCVILKEEPNP